MAAARVGAAGLAAVIVLLTSATMSPSGRGEFAALQAAALLLAAGGGLSLALGISVVVGKDEHAAPRAAAVGLLSSLLLAAILTPVAAALAGPLGIDQSTAVAAALVGATIAGYGSLQGLSIGLDRMHRYAGAEVARSVTSLTAIAVALVAGTRNPATLVAVWVAGPIAGALVLLGLARRRADHPPHAVPWTTMARHALRRSLRAHPTNLVGFAVARLDIVLLAAVSTRPQVAYYSLAVVFAEAAWLLPSALATVALSDYVRLPAAQALQAARAAVARTVAASAVTGVLAGLTGVVSILVFLPDAYHSSFAPLWIVIAGTVPYSIGHVASPFLVTAVDRPGIATAIAAATLVVDLALVAILGGPHGAAGAAIASTAAYGLNAALNAVALSRAGVGTSGQTERGQGQAGRRT